MKIQTKLIDGNMMGREVNRAEKYTMLTMDEFIEDYSRNEFNKIANLHGHEKIEHTIVSKTAMIVLEGNCQSRSCSNCNGVRCSLVGVLNPEWNAIEAAATYLPAPAFDKEDVWEADIQWQFYNKFGKYWTDCSQRTAEMYCTDIDTRQIYIPKEVKKENMEKTPLELIAAERVRKAAVYGYDDKAIIERTEDYGSGELALAAACYCEPFFAKEYFPWDDSYFKPTPDDRIKELVKAGSFIVDEIMRLQANHLK